MPITIDHSPGARSYGGQLYRAAAAESYADRLLPFVGQYTQQQFQSGEAEKQRGWQSGESEAQRGWQSGESALDRNLTMYGNDKGLAMQALLAQYQTQAQLASQRISSGRPLNPMHIHGNTINGMPADQYAPNYGGPGTLDYQSVLSMPSYQQPLLTSNYKSSYQRG